MGPLLEASTFGFVIESLQFTDGVAPSFSVPFA